MTKVDYVIHWTRAFRKNDNWYSLDVLLSLGHGTKSVLARKIVGILTSKRLLFILTEVEIDGLLSHRRFLTYLNRSDLALSFFFVLLLG